MNAEEAEILRIYKKLMAEVLARTDAIGSILNNETGLEARFAREAAHLQLRMICESIALGCIVAHEGFSDLSVRKLHKSYGADQIMNELSKLHDRFYPQPVTIKHHTTGRFGVNDHDVEHLTKDALIATYRKCGSVLHRGTPTMIRAGEKIEKDWIAYVNDTTQLAVNLLGQHALVMRGDTRAIFCEFMTSTVWAAKAV